MRFYRTRPVQYIILLMTGLAFLNLTFVQSEVIMLGLNKESHMMKNIATMLATAASEEEREGGECADTDSLEKELDIFYHASAFEHLHSFRTSVFSKRLPGQDMLYCGYLQEFYPPPEVWFSIR